MPTPSKSSSPSTTPQNRRQPDTRRGISTLVLLALTALFLPLLFPPFYCFFLAPIALVPFCICVIRRPLKWKYLGCYYLLGLAFFIPNLFWLAPVTIGGYIALACYVALYFPLFAIGLHRLVVQLRLPATLAVPLLWTAVEFIRASFVLGGFPWFLLGNSLAPMPIFIQVADLFGVWGISFFIAMLNGFFLDALRLPLRMPARGGGTRFSPAIQRLGITVSAVFLFVLAYGIFRLNQQTTTPGPRVAVIQANIPQSVKDDSGNSDDIFELHFKLAASASNVRNNKPDLVGWPETMVPAWINDEFTRANSATWDKFDTNLQHVFQLQAQAMEFRLALLQLSKETGVPQLIGYGYFNPIQDYGHSIKQNRSMLILPTGAVEREYSKVHLVPFGEFIPFRGLPVIGHLMLYLTPYHEDYSNEPGHEWTRFQLSAPAPPGGTPNPGGEGPETTAAQPHTYEFGTPICFEDVMPYPARKMTAPQFHNGRKADFLLNVSNDGWFHWVELDQHLQAAQLRAVENRVPIARSINTGNSGFIDSNGRIVSLVRNAQGVSIGAVGTASEVLHIDSRITLFSKIGDLFPIVCGIMATLLTAWTFVRPRRP